MQEQITFELPELAGRKAWREHGKTFRSTYKVPFEIMEVIPEWNPRTDFEGIEELAESIMVNGLQEPIRGDLSSDGKRFFIRDGERRYRAIKHLIDNDIRIVDEVEVLPYSPKATEEEKLILNLSSDNKMKYKPMEIARGLQRLKFGPDGTERSNEEIGHLIGKSRQYVDNYIALAKAPEEVKKEVEEGTLKPTKAIKQVREKTSLKDEMTIGNVRKSNTNTGNTYIPGENESKDAGPAIDFEKEETEQEKWVNNIAKNLNKIEALGKGLNEQGQTDLDNYLKWIRNDIDTLKIFIANKAKDVTKFVSLETVQSLMLSLSDRGKLSDGYHTYDELYEHRCKLYIVLCHQLRHNEDAPAVWRTKVHSDGTIWDGWFLLGIGEVAGQQITYHLPETLWDNCSFALEYDKAPEFDGHTSADVLERLLRLMEL